MSLTLHTRRSIVTASKRINSSGIGVVPPAPAPVQIIGETSGSAVTGTISIPASTTGIKVYGVAGGGNGNSTAGPSLYGGNGGSGGSAQLNGYPISVTGGEILSYSVGSYAQATTLTRQGNVIFTLTAGSSDSLAVPVGSYGSHGGGAGGAGGARYSVGNPAPSGTIIGGGGGGGGYGDTSPLTAGGLGGNGGAGPAINLNTSIGGSAVTFISAIGGSGGTAAVAGANVLTSYGGAETTIGKGPWSGGGGGAGGGIKVSSFPNPNIAYGGGGGGGGSGGGIGGQGGAGFMIVEYL